ncbi:MAG: hypothetical protein SXV54_12160, partial [Chloroflexota bacterium]|nr:hypothetical protein [Chloroflexota bacterium]
VQLFLMRLCYSRKLFVRAFPTQRQEAFFEGHVTAFHHFRGVPRRISYDNLKVAVQRILEGRNRQEQQGAASTSALEAKFATQLPIWMSYPLCAIQMTHREAGKSFMIVQKHTTPNTR